MLGVKGLDVGVLLNHQCLIQQSLPQQMTFPWNLQEVLQIGSCSTQIQMAPLTFTLGGGSGIAAACNFKGISPDRSTAAQ